MTPHRKTARALAAALVALFACLLTVTSAVPAGADDTDPTGKDDKKSAATVGVRTANAHGGDDRGGYDYEVLPRGVVQDWVAVSNLRYEPITVRLFAKDATSAPGASYSVQKTAEAPTDLGAWITLKKNKLTIPPRTELVVPFQLGVPYDATPGDHAAAIVVSLLAREPKPGGGTIIVDHRVGMRVHLRVPGDLKPALTIENLEVSWNGESGALGRGDVKVSYLVHNTGNVVMNATGDLELGRVLGMPSVKAGAREVEELLPGGSTLVERVVKDVSGTGPMKATVTLHGVPADPALEDKETDVTETRGFPAWPWLLIAIVVTLLVLFGTGGWYELRRRTRRKARLAADRADEVRAQELAKHRLTVRAALAGSVAAIATVLVLTPAAPAGAAEGDTWKARISKKEGVAGEPFDILTSGGCPQPATNIVGFGYGAGFPEEGAVVVSNTGPVDNEQGFTAALVDNMVNIMALQPEAQQLRGTYKFVIRCITAEWPDRSYGEYVAAITFDNPGHWRALPPLTQEKGPVARVPTTGPNGEPKTSDQGAQGGPAAPGDADTNGGTADTEAEQSGSAEERAEELLATNDTPDGGSGSSWLLPAAGVIAALSLLLAFGKKIPRPGRRR